MGRKVPTRCRPRTRSSGGRLRRRSWRSCARPRRGSDRYDISTTITQSNAVCLWGTHDLFVPLQAAAEEERVRRQKEETAARLVEEQTKLTQEAEEKAAVSRAIRFYSPCLPDVIASAGNCHSI